MPLSRSSGNSGLGDETPLFFTDPSDLLQMDWTEISQKALDTSFNPLFLPPDGNDREESLQPVLPTLDRSLMVQQPLSALSREELAVRYPDLDFGLVSSVLASSDSASEASSQQPSRVNPSVSQGTFATNSGRDSVLFEDTSSYSVSPLIQTKRGREEEGGQTQPTAQRLHLSSSGVGLALAQQACSLLNPAAMHDSRGRVLTARERELWPSDFFSVTQFFDKIYHPLAQEPAHDRFFIAYAWAIPRWLAIFPDREAFKPLINAGLLFDDLRKIFLLPNEIFPLISGCFRALFNSIQCRRREKTFLKILQEAGFTLTEYVNLYIYLSRSGLAIQNMIVNLDEFWRMITLTEDGPTVYHQLLRLFGADFKTYFINLIAYGRAPNLYLTLMMNLYSRDRLFHEKLKAIFFHPNPFEKMNLLLGVVASLNQCQFLSKETYLTIFEATVRSSPLVEQVPILMTDPNALDSLESVLQRERVWGPAVRSMRSHVDPDVSSRTVRSQQFWASLTATQRNPRVFQQPANPSAAQQAAASSSC